MKKKKDNNVFFMVSRIIFLILGLILVFIGFEMFLIFNNIIDGGMIGIFIMVSYIIKGKLGMFFVIFNLFFIIIGYR